MISPESRKALNDALMLHAEMFAQKMTQKKFDEAWLEFEHAFKIRTDIDKVDPAPKYTSTGEILEQVSGVGAYGPTGQTKPHVEDVFAKVAQTIHPWEGWALKVLRMIHEIAPKYFSVEQWSRIKEELFKAEATIVNNIKP